MSVMEGGQKSGDGPPLMTQQEVAELFRCTARTIRNWTKDGLIMPHRIGRSVFYHRAAVENLAGLS